MDEGDNLYALMSYHGTILCADMLTGNLRHRSIYLRDGEQDGVPVQVKSETDDSLNSLPKKFSCNSGILSAGTPSGEVVTVKEYEPNHVSLNKGGFLLTADRDGSVKNNATAVLQWETFFLLSWIDFAILRYIISKTWCIGNERKPVYPKDIQISENFVLHFGCYQIQLSTALPPRHWLCDEVLTLPESTVIQPGSISTTTKSIKAEVMRQPLLRGDGGKIWIKPLGNLGNRALQYLVAEQIRSLVPGVTIENIILPEWGISLPASQPALKRAARLGQTRYWFDVDGVSDCLRRGVIDTLILDSFCFNISHYPPRDVCRSLIGPTIDGESATGFSASELVCSVRAAEILRGEYPDYILLPPAYYKLLQEKSGLDLVFFGQIGDDAYSTSLRAAFPLARFIAGRNPQYDFQMLRRSVHIAPSISTFSWLAAWLSEAEQIYLPIGGMFNPVQHPHQTYIPLEEPSYRFILLPYCKAINIFRYPEAFAAQQALLGQQLKWISLNEARGICTRAEWLHPHYPYVGGFDPSFYGGRYRDLFLRLQEDLPSLLEYYLDEGSSRGRNPVDIDQNYYIFRYPDVAERIARGHYLDPLDHYTKDGWRSNYETYP